MIRVQGYVDGVAYAAVIDPDATPDEETGVITECSPRTAASFAAVEAQIGTVHEVTPTGPDVAADLSTPAGALAALHEATEVVSVTGDVPEEFRHSRLPDDGVVY